MPPTRTQRRGTRSAAIIDGRARLRSASRAGRSRADGDLAGTEHLLGALETGGSLDELSEFLAARSAEPLPDPVLQLLQDLRERAGRIEDGGVARLVACDDAALAALIANDTRTRRLCMLAGDRHIVVPARSERAFRRALREPGYPVPGPSELRDAA